MDFQAYGHQWGSNLVRSGSTQGNEPEFQIGVAEHGCDSFRRFKCELSHWTPQRSFFGVLKDMHGARKKTRQFS